MEKHSYRQMICLVGENPLPVYIGIRKLSTPDARIWLVCSEGGTDSYAKAIKSLVELDNDRNEESRSCNVVSIPDPYDPNAIREVISGFDQVENTALNITGGTKVMSAFSVTAWKGGWEGIFYVEDGRRKFHFANGVTEDIGDLDLTLDDLGRLHGVEIPRNLYGLAIPSLRELKGYYHEIESRDRSVHSQYRFNYSVRERDELKRFESNIVPFQNCFRLVSKEIKSAWGMPETLPASIEDYKISEWKPVFDFFAKGEWFECLIYQLAWEVLHSVDKDYPLYEIAFRRKCVKNEYYENVKIDSQIFEGDIFLVFGNRLRFLSVTTSLSARACKAKMFEAIHRARQIGGDLATSGVVCLASDRVLNSCRVSIAKYPRHNLFGRFDVNNCVKGDTESLAAFLTQDFIMNEPVTDRRRRPGS